MVSFRFHYLQLLPLLLCIALNTSTVTAFAPPTTNTILNKRSSIATNSQLNAAVTIYGHPGTRSPLVNWACIELGINYEMGDLQYNPHPFGQLPCLTDDNDVMVFESGAILEYLNIKYSKNLSESEMAAITSWIVFANASLDPICFIETPDGKVYDTGLKNPNNRKIKQLDDIFSKQEWLLGDDKFTLADIAIASYILYVLLFFPNVTLYDKYPSLAKYTYNAVCRPTYGQAFGDNTQIRLQKQLENDKELSLSNNSNSNKKIFGMF